MTVTNEELVKDFEAELTKAFRERYPFDVPPGDNDVSRAYHQAATNVLQAIAPAARDAFITFVRSCKINL